MVKPSLSFGRPVRKIIHLSVVRQLSSGQEKQLLAETAASLSLSDVSWLTLAFHNGRSHHSFVKTIPVIWRPIPLRYFFAWIVIAKLSRECDFILVRYMPFDPFSLIFAPFIKNRVSVHHSLELQELPLIKKGWRGRLAASFEQLVGSYSLRRAAGILGVTDEIAQYQKARAGVGLSVCAYPNGVVEGQISTLEDARADNNEVHAAFLCGTFSSWHGLDKLMDLTSDPEDGICECVLVIHLIGQLSFEQMKLVKLYQQGRVRFVEHGLMSESGYRPILARCDFGLTSLALERKGIREASTLKVREMLAMGLAIYSGHYDIALDQRQPFVRVNQSPTFDDLVGFGLQCRAFSRDFVRRGAAPLIDKRSSMLRVVDYVRKLRASP